MWRSVMLLLCFYLMSWNTFALAGETVNVKTKLVIAANGFIPPFVIQKGNTGFQLELIRASFHAQGYDELEFVYMSNKRAELAMKNGMVDAVVNLPNTYNGEVYVSDPIVDYHNIAVTLSGNRIRLETLQDLRGLGVVAFQNASTFLGSEYFLMTKQLRSYEEIVNQAAQVELLMKGWADVIILEHRVFEYYLAKFAKMHPVKEVSYHYLFDAAPRPIYFQSELMRDIFNAGLNSIKVSGEYQAILATTIQVYAQR